MIKETVNGTLEQKYWHRMQELTEGKDSLKWSSPRENRWASSSIFCVSSAPFVEEAAFPSMCVFGIFIKSWVAVVIWGFTWILYSVHLQFCFRPSMCRFEYCGSVGKLEIRSGDIISMIFYAQHCFDYSGSFVFSVNFWKFFSSSLENKTGILMGITLNL